MIASLFWPPCLCSELAVSPDPGSSWRLAPCNDRRCPGRPKQTCKCFSGGSGNDGWATQQDRGECLRQPNKQVLCNAVVPVSGIANFFHLPSEFAKCHSAGLRPSTWASYNQGTAFHPPKPPHHRAFGTTPPWAPPWSGASGPSEEMRKPSR